MIDDTLSSQPILFSDVCRKVQDVIDPAPELHR